MCPLELLQALLDSEWGGLGAGEVTLARTSSSYLWVVEMGGQLHEDWGQEGGHVVREGFNEGAEAEDPAVVAEVRQVVRAAGVARLARVLDAVLAELLARPDGQDAQADPHAMAPESPGHPGSDPAPQVSQESLHLLALQ